MSSKDLRQTKRHEINTSLIVAGIIIFIAIIWFYLSFISDNTFIFAWDKLWIPMTIGFIFIITYILSTILIINRLLKDNKIEIEIPTCEKRVCSLVNEIYPHARGYISRQFSVLYKNHESFAKDIGKIEGIEKKDLAEIAKDAENSVYGRFLCVLSDVRYYPTLDKTITTSQAAKDLIDYFIRFEKHTKKNHITRIFTCNQNNDLYSKQIFLQYLLANDISGMDTYVLFSKEEEVTTELQTSNSSKYFPYIDYVISDILNKNTHQRETKVYFSYEVSENEPDKTIVSNDDFLLHLLETDFANRLDTIKIRTTQSHCVKLSKETFIQILQDIGLISTGTKKNTYKEEINGIINELSDFIDKIANSTADEKTKKKLKAKLNLWHIR